MRRARSTAQQPPAPAAASPTAPPAQPAFQMPPPTPNDTLKPVEVDADHHVHFRIWAPNATDVKVQAEGPESTPDITLQEAYKNIRGLPLVKDDRGVWEAVIGPIEPGVYRYTFSVDGVNTTDPKNPLTSQALTHSTSLYEVPGADFMERKPGVPRGVIATVYYDSSATGTNAGCTSIPLQDMKPARTACPCSTSSTALATLTTHGEPSAGPA